MNNTINYATFYKILVDITRGFTSGGYSDTEIQSLNLTETIDFTRPSSDYGTWRVKQCIIHGVDLIPGYLIYEKIMYTSRKFTYVKQF